MRSSMCVPALCVRWAARECEFVCVLNSLTSLLDVFNRPRNTYCHYDLHRKRVHHPAVWRCESASCANYMGGVRKVDRAKNILLIHQFVRTFGGGDCAAGLLRPTRAHNYTIYVYAKSSYKYMGDKLSVHYEQIGVARKQIVSIDNMSWSISSCSCILSNMRGDLCVVNNISLGILDTFCDNPTKHNLRHTHYFQWARYYWHNNAFISVNCVIMYGIECLIDELVVLYTV